MRNTILSLRCRYQGLPVPESGAVKNVDFSSDFHLQLLCSRLRTVTLGHAMVDMPAEILWYGEGELQWLEGRWHKVLSY